MHRVRALRNLLRGLLAMEGDPLRLVPLDLREETGHIVVRPQTSVAARGDLLREVGQPDPESSTRSSVDGNRALRDSTGRGTSRTCSRGRRSSGHAKRKPPGGRATKHNPKTGRQIVREFAHPNPRPGRDSMRARAGTPAARSKPDRCCRRCSRSSSGAPHTLGRVGRVPPFFLTMRQLSRARASSTCCGAPPGHVRIALCGSVQPGRCERDKELELGNTLRVRILTRSTTSRPAKRPRPLTYAKVATLCPGSTMLTSSCASQRSAISGRCVMTSIWRNRLLRARSSERSLCRLSSS